MQHKSVPLETYIRLAATVIMSPVHNSQNAFNLLRLKFNPYCEEFWLINMNSCLMAQPPILLARGTLNFCLVHPRDLFREAIAANSYAIIIAHNHPSYETTPTYEDLKLTKRFIKIAKIIDIPIIDHLIFTDKHYYSFKENNLI